MINDNDIITIHIPDWVLKYSKDISKKFVDAETPSQFRHVGERGDTVKNDSFVGCLAHYAYCRHMWGPEGVGKLFDAYWVSNKFPEIRKIRGTNRVSDGGSDILRLNVDVKSSLVRTNLPLIKHRLPVRPYDKHPNWIYALVLVTEHEKPNATRIDDSFKYVANLVGWAKTKDLPDKPYSKEDGGAPDDFDGAYLVDAIDLCPFMPHKWEL